MSFLSRQVGRLEARRGEIAGVLEVHELHIWRFTQAPPAAPRCSSLSSPCLRACASVCARALRPAGTWGGPVAARHRARLAGLSREHGGAGGRVRGRQRKVLCTMHVVVDSAHAAAPAVLDQAPPLC